MAVYNKKWEQLVGSWRRRLDAPKYDDDTCFDDGAMKQGPSEAVGDCLKDVLEEYEDLLVDILKKAVEKAAEGKEFDIKEDLSDDQKAKYCAMNQAQLDCMAVSSCCQAWDPKDETSETLLEVCPSLTCRNGFTKDSFLGMMVGVTVGPFLLILLILLLWKKRVLCCNPKGGENGGEPAQVTPAGAPDSVEIER